MSRRAGGIGTLAVLRLARLKHWSRMILWPVLAAAASGCQSRDLVTPERLRQGLVIVLPGIEGRSLLNRDIIAGLADAGTHNAIEMHDWTAGRLAALYNLAAHGRNLKKAEKIAARIKAYQQQYPDRPVHLVGHSAGAAMVVLTLERLNETQPATAAILLGAALSPDYDLAKAIKRTQYGIYHFYSPGDVLYLGAGTLVFGTLDRKHGPAAGMVAFARPEHADPAQAALYREKLHQIAWRIEMVGAGHPGGHLGWASRSFAERYLGRIIRSHARGKTARF